MFLLLLSFLSLFPTGSSYLPTIFALISWAVALSLAYGQVHLPRMLGLILEAPLPKALLKSTTIRIWEERSLAIMSALWMPHSFCCCCCCTSFLLLASQIDLFFFLDIVDSTASEGWHKVCGDRVSKEKQLSPLRQSQHASHLTLIKGEHWGEDKSLAFKNWVHSTESMTIWAVMWLIDKSGIRQAGNSWKLFIVF